MNVIKLMRVFTAILLDIFGAVCGLFSGLGVATNMIALIYMAEALSFIPDVFGFFLLNPSSGLSGSKELKNQKGRFMVTFILELLPFGFLPIWTINELFSK